MVSDYGLYSCDDAVIADVALGLGSSWNENDHSDRASGLLPGRVECLVGTDAVASIRALVQAAYYYPSERVYCELQTTRTDQLIPVALPSFAHM